MQAMQQQCETAEVYRDKEGNIVERPDVIEALKLADAARLDADRIESALRRFVPKWKRFVSNNDYSAAEVERLLRIMRGQLAWCVAPPGSDRRIADRGWISQAQFEAIKKMNAAT